MVYDDRTAISAKIQPFCQLILLLKLERYALSSILGKRQSLHGRIAEVEKRQNQLESQIDRLQPLANIGTVSAMIAHEINNILTPLGSYAQLSLEHPDDSELTQKTIQQTAAKAARAAKMLKSILSMANGQSQQKNNCPLNDIFDDIFSCIARDFKKDRIKVTRNIPDGLEVYVESVSFQQVLMNLILNARHAMLNRGGTLTLSANIEMDRICIEIKDTGCGIEPNLIEDIFEPFFSTKSDSTEDGGTGLGLAFSKRVVESHGGSISVKSTLRQGTTFIINIPAK